MARSAGYRTLLSGLEEEPAAPVGDRIEALADVAAGRTACTAAAWTRTRRPAPANGPGPARRSHRRRRASAPGLAAAEAAAGGSTWPPPPNCWPGSPPCRPVTRLRPRRPRSASPATTAASACSGCCSEFRRPLLIGLVLVVLDALAALAGPVLVKTGIDSGVSKGRRRRAVRGVGRLPGRRRWPTWSIEIGETFVTGRAAERIMLSLRIRIWAQLQRLSLDYYESEMAGRIMTRMTTDVDQFESLIENGLLSALVSLVTFVGVGVALVVINPELGLLHPDRRRPAGGRHGGLPAAGGAGCTTCPGNASRSSTPTSRRACPGSASPRRSSTRPRPRRGSTASAATTSTPGSAAQRLVAHLLPVRAVPVRRRRRDRARRRRRADRHGPPRPRAP